LPGKSHGRRSLVGCFNGNANDASGNGNDGDINEGTDSEPTLTTDRFGNENSAYSFDGDNDYIATPLIPNFSLDQSFTVVAWYKTTTSNISQRILGVREDMNSITILLGFHSPEGLHFQLRQDISNNTELVGDFSSTDGYWHHVAGVFNATTNLTELFLDGEIIASTYFNGNLNDQTRKIYIGAGNIDDGPKEYFNGSIDDIRIYNRALSDVEIDSLYHDGGWNPNSIPEPNHVYFNTDDVLSDGLGTTPLIQNNTNQSVIADTFNGVDCAYWNGYCTLPPDGNYSSPGGDGCYLYSNGVLISGTATFDFWVKWEGENDYGTLDQAIVYERAISWGFTQLQFSIPDDRLWFTQGNSDNYFVDIIPSLGDNLWHHVLVSKTNNFVSIYFDGENVATSETSSGGSANYTYFGAKRHRSAVWNGWMHKFRIWNNVEFTFEEALSAYLEEVSVFNQPTEEDLVAYYPFNGNANESGNGNDGINSGATPTTDRFGNESNAYSFDGVDDKVNLENVVSLESSMSVCAWIYPNLVTGFRGIVGDGEGNYAFHFQQKENTLEFAMAGIGGTSGGTLTAGNWQFVCATYNGSTAEIYIDGSLVNSITISGNMYDCSDCRIGSTNNGRYYDGKIDDVRIYNRALSSSEIQALYQQ